MKKIEMAKKLAEIKANITANKNVNEWFNVYKRFDNKTLINSLKHYGVEV